MTRGKLVALVAAAAVGAALALGARVVLTAPDTALPWSAFGGGGGSASSASYGLGATAGQPAIGQSDSAGYRLGAGYSYGIDKDGDNISDPVDNCPAWPNATQDLPPWPVPADDPDCDGFSSTIEQFVGTLPLVQCADATPNNESPDPWPTDFDDDRDTDIFDVLSMKPFFGSPGSNPYSARYDLQGQDGDVDIFDVLAMKPFFAKSCT